MRLYFKGGMILLYLACGYVAVVERVSSFGLSLQLGLYLGVASALTACIVAAALVTQTALRIGYALLLFASAFFLASMEAATGEHLTYEVFVNMLNARGSVGDAIRQYGASIILGFVTALPLLIGIALSPARVPGPWHVYAAAPLAGAALLTAILFSRGGDGGRALPGAFTTLAYGSLYAVEAIGNGGTAREPVSLPITHPPAYRDIVLIIDESVLGSYLDINNPAGVRSGLLDARPGITVRNYGYAASITNCSAGSNVTLRYGGTRQAYRRINATMPSIWAYARGAGMRTVYIDAQGTGGMLQNLIDEDERREIDLFIQFNDVKVRDRDMAAADRLAQFLQDERSNFILVNKVGAHFPVHDKFPDSHMRYQPAAPRGMWENISDTGRRDGFSGAAEDWRRYRNAYRNTLLWNVGSFFDRLLADGGLAKALLIYTADHGQDLHEQGAPGITTHCSSDPVDEEGLVPLVIVESAGSAGMDWDRHLASNRNRASHYNIFPTLVRAMGYDPAGVRAHYGRAIDEETDDPLTFNSRFNARLGKEPRWRRIEIESVAPISPLEGG